MYSNGCVACPPPPAAGPFWPPVDGSSPSSGVAALPGPYAAAIYSEAVKRTSFYISDILYPTVIPLPGTLPLHLAGAMSMGPIRSPGLSSPPLQRDSQSSEPTSPRIQSKDLKFGIDRILDEKQKFKSVQSPPREKVLSPDISAHGDSPCTSSRSSTSSPPCSYPLCPCSNTSHTASSCPTGLYAYPRLVYRSPPSGHHQSAHHPIHHHSSGLPPHLGQHYSLSRQSEFPGPYAILTPDHSSSHQQVPGQHHHPHQGHQSHQQQPKRKRSWSRAVFSHLQRKGLEKRFEVQKYVTKPDRKQLAAMLGLTDAQVKVWFQNRRMKWRHAEEAKRKKEEEDKKKEGTDDSIKSEKEDLLDPEQHFEIESDDEELEVDESDLDTNETNNMNSPIEAVDAVEETMTVVPRENDPQTLEEPQNLSTS